MGAARPPIYSTRADDPAAIDAIAEFLVRVAERIDTLQDAERDGNLKDLAALAGTLAADAEALGFESLADCASTLERFALAEDPGAARYQLIELTEIACRVRLGHRGAV